MSKSKRNFRLPVKTAEFENDCRKRREKRLAKKKAERRIRAAIKY